MSPTARAPARGSQRRYGGTDMGAESPGKYRAPLSPGSPRFPQSITTAMAAFTMSSLNILTLSLCLPYALAKSVITPHGSLHQRSLLTSQAKPVDVSGAHAWQAPAADAQRGPCPGLNALANHGYISRDGIVSLSEAISAATSVYNMGLDLATLLATLGVVSGGAPVSLSPRVSIGGESKDVSILLNGLLGVAGMPQGLNLTHNLVEADSSPTRDDLFETGDAWTLNMDHFQDLLDALPEDEDADAAFDSMSDFAVKRFKQSIGSDPHFFYGPFTGLIGRNAGYLFISRLFANYSSANPSGKLDHNILKSFYGIANSSGSDLSYTYGHERIPSNWYPRSTPYGLAEVNADIISWALKNPELASIGGNTGTTNSFAPLDLSNLTGGVLATEQLLEGNNLMCFALEFVKLVAPSFTNNLFKTLSGPLDIILTSLSTPLLSLQCPEWNALTGGGDSIPNALEQYSIPGQDQGLL